MNTAISIPKSTISVEAAQLLAILRDCGIDGIWKNDEMNLLSFYLKNTKKNDDDNIRFDIGYAAYSFFTNQAAPNRKYLEIGYETDMRFWFLQYADSRLLSQSLRSSAQENLGHPAVKIVYDVNHPSYKRDHSEFGHLITLLMLENTSLVVDYYHKFLIERLNYYEHFKQQYGDAPILKILRRSLMRKELKLLEDAMDMARSRGKPLTTKTAGTRKYLNMISYDRIRLLRYYNFTLSNQDSGEAA